MIRIKKNQCGYKGWSCAGIPKMADGMFNSFDAQFNKLPLKIKGMVFTEETIDMGWPEGGPHPEVAELTCKSNTDPWSDSTDVSVHQNYLDVMVDGHTYQYPVYGGTSGWADLYNVKAEGSTAYFYRNTVVGSTTAVTSDVYVIADGHDYHDLFEVDSIPAFTAEITTDLEDSIEMGPGLLEPMLDTDFDPISIDTIPGWEAGIDALTFNNIVLNAWKGVVDDRFRNIYARLNSIGPGDTDYKLRDLADAANKDSECVNFQITLDSGSAVKDPDDIKGKTYHGDSLPNADGGHVPITVGSKWLGKTVTAIWQDESVWYWTVEKDPNTYTVSGGVVAYDSYTISVAAVSGIYAPFYAYLMPNLGVDTPYSNVAAADVPTVVDGGTTRMIQDGDPTLSGGTISGFTSSGSGSNIRYAWTVVGDNTAQIVIKSGTQLSEDGNADPEPGGIGIGGVRVIQSMSEDKPLVLFKIYHEDCISEIEKPEEEPAAAVPGYINISGEPLEEYLANVVVPSGTEGVPGTVIGATSGIVQPVHNIYLFGSSVGKRSESTVDVPTVEAVYNFIHGATTFKDGAFPQESALATGATMTVNGNSVVVLTEEVEGSTDSWATPGTVIVAEDIKTVLVDGKTVTASNCVPTAQAVVDYVKDLDVAAEASTVGIIGFTTNVPETLWPIPGSTVDPAAGYVQNVQNIYVGSTHSVSAYAVPTVDAVYHFIHGTTVEGMTFSSALATAGTMSYHGVEGTTVTGAEQGVYKVVQNIITIQNGTVSTRGGTTAAGYVPEAQAVIDWTTTFVAGYTATGGTTTINATTGEEWINGETVFTGIVTVAKNVKVDTTESKRKLSPYTVPTVEAVYLYVEDRIPGNAKEGWIKVSAGTESLAFITGATEAHPGLVQTVVNISTGTQSPNAVSPTAVPTVQAVIDYIHGTTITGYNTDDSRATATTTELVSGSSTTVHLKSGATRGTFFVTSDMQAITDTVTVYNDPQSVPTTMAVANYVKAYVAGQTAVAGKITVTGTGASEKENLEAAVAGTTAKAGPVQYVRNILVGGTHAVSYYAVPTVEAVHAYIHGETITGLSFSSARATIGGTTATVNGATAYGCTPGTFDVVSNIDASTVSGVVISANDVVPTADAVAKYVQSHTPGIPNSQSGILVVDSDDAEDWDEDYIPVPGIVRVSREINVSVSNRSISLQAVPSLSAVADYVAGYTASIGGFTVTGADAEDWTRSGDPVVEREAIPGIVGVVDTLVAAATVSNRTLSISTVPTVAAVKDYVDEHIPGAPVSGQLDFNGNFVNGTTVTAGIVKVSTNVKGGAAGSDARTAVPTADAVYTFVSGYQAVIGLLYAPEDDTEEWQSGHTGTSGMITVVGNMDVAPDSDNRTISKYSVPTADAVYDFVHGLVTGATAGTMEEETPEDAPTGEACTGAVSGIVLVARNVWLLDDYADRTVSNRAVPTVEAVYNFIRGYTDNYAGGASYPVANILAIPGRLGVGADGTRDSWLTGTDYAPIQGVVQTAGNIVAGSTAGDSTTAVPTVRSIYNFIHSKSTFTPGRALATGSTITAPAQGTTVATYAAGGTPGTCYVCEDMEGLYGSTVTLSPTYGTYSLASVVPTVEAVKNYVAAHGGTSGGAYTGYFAADENGIADGIAIFGSTVINVTGRTTALTGTQSAWAVIWKNDNGSWGGTVGTTYSTGIKKVSYLVARRVNNEIKQVQYGGISIEGRWD